MMTNPEAIDKATKLTQVIENLSPKECTIQNVNLNSMRVFAIAARHGKFQKAAEELCISHGAVSQRIRQLEIELGTELFVRLPRGVALTRAGETYRTAVEEALEILSAAKASLETTHCQITVHIGPSTASKWLMPRLAKFNESHPEISIATEVHKDLLTRPLGRNEIAIWPGKISDGNPSNNTKPLTAVDLVAVCSPDLVNPAKALELEELISLPLLQDAHRRWEKMMDKASVHAKRGVLNFGSAALALDAAIKGHGVAIAPTFMVQQDVSLGRLVEIWRSPTPSGEHLFLSWPKKHENQKLLKQTVKWILAEFEQDSST